VTFSSRSARSACFLHRTVLGHSTNTRNFVCCACWFSDAAAESGPSPEASGVCQQLELSSALSRCHFQLVAQGLETGFVQSVNESMCTASIDILPHDAAESIDTDDGRCACALYYEAFVVTAFTSDKANRVRVKTIT